MKIICVRCLQADDACRGGVHPIEFGGPQPDDPDDFFPIHEEGLPLLLEAGELLVGEEVAEQLAPSAHAEGSEGVALAGGAEGEGTVELVGVEVGVARILQDGDRRDGKGCGDGDGDGERGGGGIAGEPQCAGGGRCLHDDVLTVDEQAAAVGGEHASAVVEGSEDVFQLRLVEAEGRECLVQHGDGGGLAEQFGDMDEEPVSSLCFDVGFLLHALGEGLAEGVLIDFLHFGEVLLGGGEVLHGSGVDALEEGEDVEPHLVAGIVVLQVGVVGHVVLPDVLQIGEDVPTGQAEEGTHHVAVPGLHSAESADAGASHGVEEEGLDVVVLMMPHGDGFGTDLVAEGAEPLIAELARRHLDADFLLTGIGLGVEVRPMECPAHLPAEGLDELLVALALVAPEVEVAVHRHHLVSQAVQHTGKAHGVGTAAQTDHHSRALCQQGISGDEFPDSLSCFFHKTSQK